MNKKCSYRSDIDGLRAIAVTAVLLNHLSEKILPGGYIGVDIFFVISGYLIAGIINSDVKSGRFTFAQFYERRVRRIFPALFVVLVVTTIAGLLLLLPSDFLAMSRGMLGAIFFSSNIVFWRDMAAGYFAATDAMLNPLLHTWSLGVEEQFYLFFPLVLIVCQAKIPRYTGMVVAVCALLSFLAAIAFIHSKSVAVFFLSPFRAWELLAGALLAICNVSEISSRFIREIVAFLGLCGILAPCFLYNAHIEFPGLAALPPVLGTALIICSGSGIGSRTLVRQLLQLRPVVYIGLISYSLYLWHWPLIVLCRYAAMMRPITMEYAALLFLASLLLASASYHFIEQPFRRGNAISRSTIYSISTVLFLILSGTSLLSIYKDGFVGRFSANVVQLDRARNPVIPYRSCDGLPAEQACILGSLHQRPDILLWGDSHLLAWAPVLNSILVERGESAILVANSACPPLFIDGNSAKESCPASNAKVKSYLESHRDVRKVVLAAYWSTYFYGDGPLVSNGYRGNAAAKDAFAFTTQWLQKMGVSIDVIGPVPSYDHSVPLALALGAATGRSFPEATTQGLQYSKNSSFFDAMKSSGRYSNITFLDPIYWMCNPDCVVMHDGIPLYRDAHHLSTTGAASLRAHLERL